jgi:hypothetical protein
MVVWDCGIIVNQRGAARRDNRRCETVLFGSHRRDFCSARRLIGWTAIKSLL